MTSTSSLTHSLAHSFTHSFTHSLTHSHFLSPVLCTASPHTHSMVLFVDYSAQADSSTKCSLLAGIATTIATGWMIFWWVSKQDQQIMIFDYDFREHIRWNKFHIMPGIMMHRVFVFFCFCLMVRWAIIHHGMNREDIFHNYESWDQVMYSCVNLFGPKVFK